MYALGNETREEGNYKQREHDGADDNQLPRAELREVVGTNFHFVMLPRGILHLGFHYLSSSSTFVCGALTRSLL